MSIYLLDYLEQKKWRVMHHGQDSCRKGSKCPNFRLYHQMEKLATKLDRCDPPLYEMPLLQVIEILRTSRFETQYGLDFSYCKCLYPQLSKKMIPINFISLVLSEDSYHLNFCTQLQQQNLLWQKEMLADFDQSVDLED